MFLDIRVYFFLLLLGRKLLALYIAMALHHEHLSPLLEIYLSQPIIDECKCP